MSGPKPPVQLNWPAHIPRIKQLAKQGMTLREAAAELNVSRVTLDVHLKRMGIRDWFPHQKVKWITYKGVTDSITGHARRRGLSRGTITSRTAAMRKSGEPYDLDKLLAPSGTHRRSELPEEIYQKFDEAMEQRKTARRELKQLTLRAMSRKLELDEKLLSAAIRTGTPDPSFSDDDWSLVCMMTEERARLEQVLAGTTVARLSETLDIPYSRVVTLLRAAKEDDEDLK